MKKIIIIAFLITLAASLRFYKLSDVPPSLNWDEASVLWNAYSLVQTGSDEYGNSLPVSIRSFEDFKPPLLSYAAAIPVYFFGKTEMAVRIPSALAAVAATGFLILLIRELGLAEGKRLLKLSLISALFLAVSPWHLVFSRIAFEASLGLSSFTLAAFFLARFIRTKKNYLFFFSLLFFVAGFYTHHSIRLAFPLFLCAVVLLNFRLFWQKLTISVLGLLLMAALLFPLFYSNFKYSSLNARFGQTSIFYSPGLKDISKMAMDTRQEYLIADADGFAFGTVVHSKILLYSKLFLKNYLDHYNFNYLFLTGDANQRHSVPDVGMLLIFELPFILAGGYFLLIKRQKWSAVLILWFLIAPVASALTTETPHASRSFLLIPVYQILSAYGLLEIFKLIRKRGIKKAAALLISCLFAVNAYYFLHQYLIHLPFQRAGAWQYGYKQAVEWVNNNKQNYTGILVTKFYDQPYIYFLLYGDVSPGMKNDGTFSDGFSKYTFVNFGAMSKSQFDKISQQTLLILSPSEFSGETKTLKEIRLPDGKVAFRIAVRL